MKKNILFYISCFVVLFSCVSNAQQATKVPVPRVKFIHSSLGDFLYFLFNRKEYKAIPKLDSLLHITDVPELDAIIALPEIITSAQISKYIDIYPLLERYYKGQSATIINSPHPKRISFSDTFPVYDSINLLVKRGELYYPAFDSLWKIHVAPLEIRQIENWQIQLKESSVLENFYRITKLQLKTDELEIAAMAYHLAGSANYSPAGIYTSLFKTPNLPWVIGHEGTHLLLTVPVGADWMKSSKVKKLQKLADQKGITLYEIEENTCHFMQAMLSKICGTEKSDYSIHQPYPKGFQRDLIAAMEKDWDRYLLSKENIVDYMIQKSTQILLLMPNQMK